MPLVGQSVTSVPVAVAVEDKALDRWAEDYVVGLVAVGARVGGHLCRDYSCQWILVFTSGRVLACCDVLWGLFRYCFFVSQAALEAW